jgi:very-short-patch-repair endonuclease
MSVQRARRLRKTATDAEEQLWSRLRHRQVANLKFRRQHPLGNRTVDFFCAEATLAIELDGSGHLIGNGRKSDLDREIELYEKGIRVLRFFNHDISNNLDGVLNAIIYAVDPERSLWPYS